MALSYSRTTWADGSDGGTAITAARLNNMESGIASATTQINSNTTDIATLKDSVSNFVVKTVNSSAVSMTEGTLYDVSATLPAVTGATPVGVVGFGSNHNTSTNVLMTVISADKKTAYAKVECLTAQTDMTIRFDVLYIDA